jgi:hypothetical protein
MARKSMETRNLSVDLTDEQVESRSCWPAGTSTS